MGRRKLLYLARHNPFPVSGAARLRTFNWLLHLSREFEITFVAAVREAPAESALEALRGYCAHVHLHVTRGSALQRTVAELRYLRTGWPAEEFHRHVAMRQARDLMRSQVYDVAFAEHWTWLRHLQDQARVTVLDAGDVCNARHGADLLQTRNPLRQLMRPWLIRSFGRHESETLARAGIVLVHDEHGRRHALDATAGRTEVMSLPAGIETRYFSAAQDTYQRGHIVFHTSLAGLTQRDALTHLRHDVLPHVLPHVLRARLSVVSPVTSPELDDWLRADRRIRHVVLDDPRPVLRTGAVAVLPLRLGAGSRSRLAQLLAMGVPVVVTPKAQRALDLRSGEGVLVAPSPAEFARSVVQVLQDASLRSDLSLAAIRVARERLSLEATYRRVTDLLASTGLR